MVRSIRYIPLVTLVASLTLAQAGDWRNLRGPRFDGSTLAATPFDGPVALELVWKHAIGPGYSGVTVAGDRAVSAFSDGERDVVAAWSATHGRELWRTPIGPTYRGHDGSTDGPVATPTLTEKRVYFTGPHGDLLALSLENGAILWRKSLVTDLGARAPTYGFATNALEVDGVLVVPVGAEKHSVVGLDPTDGRLIWSTGTDRIDYASPAVVEIAGSRQVVIAGARDLVGLDPASGRQRWIHRHSERPGYDPTYPQLQPLGDQLLLTFQDESVLFDLVLENSGGPAEVAVREVWRSSAFKGTVAIPVAVGDHLYGFNGTFLTCVDRATGDTVWKSRESRGRGVMLLDDRLVVLGSGGALTIADADPAGYREIAALTVSDHGGYTAPSFAGDRIFVRNRTEIASVAIRPRDAGRRAGVRVARGFTGEIANWLQRIERADEPSGVVDAFLTAYPEGPIVIDGWVHFVFSGKADAVSIVGQMNDGEVGEPLDRVGETDLFVRSYPVLDGGLWNYRFQLDFAAPQVDPRNPDRAAGSSEEMSEVVLPGFTDPSFVTASATATGQLETLTVASAAYGTDIPVDVYLPAGYDAGARYPLIVMPNGREWIDAGGIVAILDNLFEDGTQPAIVALVPIGGWVAGSWGGRAVTLLGSEVLPAVVSAYPIAEGTAHRALWTVEDKAAVGMTLALDAPDAFGRFAFQSPKLYFAQLPDLAPLAARATAFRVSWSRYELRAPESGTDERAAAAKLFEQMRLAGLPLEGGEFVAGPGYRTWRTEADAILTFLLGRREGN